MMKLRRYLTILLFALFALSAVRAEEVIVTVSPLRPILPPQVMLYISNPGQYFTISVQNTSDEPQAIYFGAEIRQLTPTTDMEVIVPGKTMPRVPVEVPAKGTKLMTAAEMRTMFNHVQMNDVIMPQDIFSNVTSNSFGNLPEGNYEIIILAYKWDPHLKSPVLISNPTLGKALFTVCYQGRAPEWISPVPMGDFAESNIATLSKQTPLLTWMSPIITCSSIIHTFTYDIKVVQSMPLQAPDEAIERNPVVYQATGLTMPQCMIPISVVNGMSPIETYVAQITAKSNATQIGSLDYIELMNNGKSDLKLFRVKDYTGADNQITKYSAPELISPEGVASSVSQIATLNPEEPVVKWKAPVATGFLGRQVSFSYDVKIVEPTSDYEKTLSSIQAALDDLTPIYEKKGIRALQDNLPEELFKKINPEKMYLLQVTAHADTVLGAYKNFEFENKGKSKPSIFACLSAMVSIPKFETPKPVAEIEYPEGSTINDVAERIYKKNATIRWTTPNVQGKLDSSIGFYYDLKIVMPTQKYKINAEGMAKALDELKADYEVTKITGNTFTIPDEVFKKFGSDKCYLMRVTAHLEGNKEKIANVTMLGEGKSKPALVMFSTSEAPTTYSAPEFTSPKPMTELLNEKAAVIPRRKPTLTWKEPVMSGATDSPVSFTYNLKIVSPNADYERTLDGARAAVEELDALYSAEGIDANSHTLPKNIVEQMDTNHIYVARIYAVPDTLSGIGKNYAYKNQGKSIPAIFIAANCDVEDLSDGNVIFNDSVYSFSYPEIVLPHYIPENGARKEFIGSDIAVKWRTPNYQGGGGNEPDSIKFTYDIELYGNPEYISHEEMLKKAPVFTIKDIKGLSDTIRWEKIEPLVEKGNYMLLRVKPKAINDTSVIFTGDTLNVVDFGMTDLFTRRYFKCANQVQISNETPTKRSVDDLKGEKITIGEYTLVLDGDLTAIDGKPGHFSGNGHVIWEPLAFTWKLAVTFTDIAINTDNQVYEGNVETWGGKANKMKSSEVVDKLFSDWGIDNLIGDTDIPYADKLQSLADGKIKGLAEQLNIAEYYQDFNNGKAKVAGLLDGNIEDVTFPLEIPEKINPTPVNLTISKMKFAPTHATMDLFGTFVVPETKATQGQILVFGSPRMCISPKSLVPEGGTVALLKDFEVTEPNSGFKCKFLAPEDVMEPNNGCFVSWSENKFEWLNLDIDMTMPDDLKKVNELGKRTDESPKLHITTQIQHWEDFIATASMDPFEHVDLPGYVFTADNVIVDLAKRKNHQDQAAFPKNYDLTKCGLNANALGEWEGLYMKEVSMSFPSSIKIGNGDERMKVSLQNMFIDKSGFTADCGIVNAINYTAGENGTIGGFKFTMDNIYVSVVQNEFNKFGFDGKLEVPLFKGDIDYACNIYNQTFTKKGTGKGYAYVFKTSQIEDLNFDFMLADLSLNKDLTYFLVEALPDEQGELKTNVELCVGGEVTIAGTDMVNKKLAKLPFELSLPQIKFCKMRIANNKSFESVYEREMQEKSLNAINEMMREFDESSALFSGKWNEEEDLKLGENCYVNFGQWGAASPAKRIGPFEFTLTDWGFGFDKSGKGAELGIKLGGDIKFCSEMNITAGTTIEFISTLKNIDDISNISIDFKEVKFHEARFGMENGAFKFNGVLSVDGEDSADKGYKGLLDLEVAGGLFELSVQGGYYEHKEEGNNFGWGFFDVKAGGKCGLPIPPITLDNIHGGVYINCQYNKNNTFAPTPKKGAIGLIFGMGISTIDKVTLSGNLDLTVAFNHKTNKLSTFMFTGGVKAVGGIVNSKVKLVYEDNDYERYFQLNITADASLDGGLNDLLGEWSSSLEDDYMDPQSGFQDAMKDKSSERGKGSDYEENMKKYEKKKKADTEKSTGVTAKGPGLSVQLDIRIGHKKNVTQDENGNNIVKNGPNKWHVYLGEPEKSKRCQFILVDFKSKIVSVSIGADAYLCLGNELPGNGELPEIPEKIRKFLDGGSKDGVSSDDIKTAEKARQSAKDAFFKDGASEVSGGVMLGASVWGYINVDLGLFYGDLGAEAGFDISVRKLSSNVMCVNLPDGPGRNGWYGEGQLYAYLYAKFGLRINLGFFKKKIDLIDCGIGGVLRCGMPNPNYFTGKARVKIRLLGGLVNLNKKFSFECGDKCEFFYGNALDDYKMFEKCDIGVETREEALANPIDWERQNSPVVETQPVIGNVIQVVDPTERARIMEERQGKTAANEEEGEESFDEWSMRSFRFMLTAAPQLTEYSNESDFKNDRNGKTFEVEHTQNGTKLTMNLTRFNANRYYRLRMKGRSQEFHQGKWQDPWTFDTITRKFSHKEWAQTKDFYFVTNNKQRTFQDDEELQPHVAIAFPAKGVRNISPDKYGNPNKVKATMYDAQMPSISLKYPMKGKVYNKGSLKWYVYREGKLQGTKAVTWFENDSVSVIMPSDKLPGMEYGRTSRVCLRYEWQEQVQSAATWVPIKTYNVTGLTRKQVILKYSKQYPSILSTSTPSRTRNRKNYRIDVQQYEYLNDETDENDIDDSASDTSFGSVNNKLRFKVTILELKSGMVTVTHTKDLYDVNVIPSYKDWTPDQLFAATSNAPEWQSLEGLRLNYIYANGYSIDENSTYLSALQTLSNKLPAVMTSAGTNRLVTQNPFFYLTYLSKSFFIGGVHWKAFDMELLSTSSLEIKSPYGVWTNGILNGHLGEAYSEVRDMAMLEGKMLYKRYASPYPLYTRSSSNDSEFENKQKGFITAHQLTERAYAEVLADYYKICAKINARINDRCTWLSQFKNKSDRDLLIKALTPYRGTWETFTGSAYNYDLGLTFPVVRFPHYQFYLIFNAAQGVKMDITGNIFDIPKNSRHKRILGGSNDYVGRRIFYTAVTNKNNIPEKFQRVWEVVNFDAEKIAKFNNYKFSFTRYRVNAWNFKNGAQRFTVWTPVPGYSYTFPYNHNGIYTKTYSTNFTDLMSKYGIRLK